MDLHVTANSTVTMDGRTDEHADALKAITLRSLADLQSTGLVSKRVALGELLDRAKHATASAIERIKVQHRVTADEAEELIESDRVDLGRYSDYARGLSSSLAADVKTVWEVLRPYRSVAAMPVTVNTASIQVSAFIGSFFDITIESNGTLVIGAKVKKLLARDILIKKGGVLKLGGKSLRISARSIRGFE